MNKRSLIFSIIFLAAVTVACAPTSGLDEDIQPSVPADSAMSPSDGRNEPANVPTSSITTPRDWVAELVLLGYLPSEGSTSWIDEMMFDRAPDYCLSSLTGPGDDPFAKLYDLPEFESAVTRRVDRSIDSVRELKTIGLIVERFCDDRMPALKTVIRLHPELGVSTDDLEVD